MSSIDTVKQRVRLLLNVARDDAAADGEIENALRFARRMMEAHHLTEDDLADDRDAHEETLMDDVRVDSLSFGLVSWEKWLAGFVEDFVGSIGCYLASPQENRKDGRLQFNADHTVIRRAGIVFFGPADEIAIAEEMYRELHQTIAATARLKFGSVLRGSGRSYGVGFVKGLRHKLDYGRKQDERDPQTRALIVQSTAIAKRKQDRAIDWLKTERGVSLGSARYSSLPADPYAHAEGVRDGKATDVRPRRTGRIAGSSPKLLT